MTEPYYQDDYATLYLGDCRAVLAGLPKESVDLVVTDPPYGVSHNSSWRAESFGVIANDGAEDRDVIRAALTECVRVVGQRRHLYVFGPTDVLDGLKVSEPAELIWDRGVVGQGDLSSPWGPQHERITFAVSMFRHAGKAGSSTLPVRLRKGSVLRFTRPTGRKTLHPNQKPVALLRELIESSSRAGDMVLDPFAGIASTGVAATLSGRRSVLVELDEKYASLGAERLARAAEIAREAAAA